MKCPKCGKDYEGIKCPFCGGLDIVVNDNDYERRKKAYEEMKKQKEEAAEKPKKLKKEKKNPKESKLKSKKTSNAESEAELNQDSKSDNGGGSSEKGKKSKLIVGTVIGLVLVACIVGVGYFSVRSMVSIYFKIGEDIYKDDYNTELVQQQVYDTQIWNADKSRLFTAAVPAEINQKNAVQEMASMNGDYFGAVTYDDVQKYYTIWVWDEKANKSERMITSENQLELVYVADDSSVIYRSNEIIGDGTLIGNSLNRVDSSKNVYMINENVKKELVFLRDKSIAYVTKEGNLYVSQFGNVRESTLISSNVSTIMGELKNCSDRYSENTEVVHDSHMVAQLVYINDNKVYYCNLNHLKDKKMLFETEKTGMDIVYQENAESVYSINRLTVDGIILNGNKYEATPLATKLQGTDVVYLPKQEAITYITDTGKLIAIRYKKGSFVKNLLEGGENTKLTLKEGKTTAIYQSDGDEGLLVINDEKMFFFRNIEDEPIVLAQTKCQNIMYVSYYGRKLYVVDDTKTMYIFDTKGKLEDTVKDTEFIWVG